ncbi:MAG: ABC transporter permease [Bacteroidales bacterium]
MLTLLRIELYKIFTRKRSYIGFFAVIVIVVLAQAGMLWEGRTLHQLLTKNLSDTFFMQGNLVNGYLVSYLILNFLWIHVPLLIVIVTGDLISGESQGGTLRLVLSRPVSRTGLVTAKFLAAIGYTFILMVLFAFFSLLPGLVLFGKGDLMVIFNAINIIPQDDLLWRFLLAYFLGFLAMTSVASLSLFFSAHASNSLGPIITTMAVIILFTLISTFNFELFAPVKPFLLTSYLNSWQQLFLLETDMQAVWRDAAVLLIHIVLFYTATVITFNRRDILS